MKHLPANALIWVAALFLPTMALAEDASSGGSPATTARGTTVREEVKDALESQAKLPKYQPTLPDQASDRAREVHSGIAFGHKAAAERAAHRSAETARSDSATAAARTAANAAADRASRNDLAAAAERRAEEVRKGLPPSRPTRGKPF